MHRFPGTAHQESEDDLGVRRSEPAQFRCQREGQQKVVGRDEALHLTLGELDAGLEQVRGIGVPPVPSSAQEALCLLVC